MKKSKTKGQKRREKYARFSKKAAPLVLVFLFALMSSPVYAWLGTWGFRYPVIVNTSTNITDYQINVSFAFPTGNMQADCDDIRATNASDTLLNHWIWICNSTNVKFTFKGNFTTANGTQAYIYFGNSTATNASSYNTTFTKEYNGTSNLLLEYHLDEGSGASTIDYSGKGNNGTITGASWIATDGGTWRNVSVFFPNGKHLNFTESPASYIVPSSAIVLHDNEGWSLEAWYKTSDSSDGGATPRMQHMIFGWTDANTYAAAGVEAGKMCYQHYSGAWFQDCAAATISDGSWHYLAWTNLANESMYLYIDGVLASSASSSIDAGHNLDIYSMGKSYPTGSEVYSNGTIDEIRIFNRTLSASEVLAHYERRNFTSPEPTSSLGAIESQAITITIASPTNSTINTSYVTKMVLLNTTTTGNSSNYSCSWKIDTGTPSNFTATNNTAYLENMTISTPGSHTLNVSCNNSGGANASSAISFYLKYQSGISLNSSNGWAITEGSATTISCSAYPAVLLYINDAPVSNPYSFTPAAGTYAAKCNVSDTSNWTETYLSSTLVVNKYVSCFNSTTAGFELNITPADNWTTLNFTSLAASFMVREDLRDVWIVGLTNNSIFTNFTGGSYLVVNNTGLSSFTLRFSNYGINNNSWSQTNRSATAINVSNYTQINSVVSIHLADELNETSLYPENTTISAILECSRGENYFVLQDNLTTFTFAGLSDYSRVAINVKYSPTIYYSRQRYINTSQDLNYITFYVIDAYDFALDRIDFKMLDSQKYNDLLQIYKEQGDVDKIIDEGYFDASHYHSVYLIEDVTYYIRTIDADYENTEFGIMVITAPGEKELSKTTIDLNPDAQLIADCMTFNTYKSGNLLYVYYDDVCNGTEQANITIYFMNGTIFQAIQYNDTDTIDLNYDVSAYTNMSFKAAYSVNHATLGNSPVQQVLYVVAGSSIFPGLSSLWTNIVALFVTISSGALASRKTLIAGALLSIISLLIFIGIGWFSELSLLGATFFIVLIILGLAYHFQHEG